PSFRSRNEAPGFSRLRLCLPGAGARRGAGRLGDPGAVRAARRGQRRGRPVVDDGPRGSAAAQEPLLAARPGAAGLRAGHRLPSRRRTLPRRARASGAHAALQRVDGANGMMQVWSGLMLRVDNEAQLAAVLGHEIGHYLARHSVEQLRDAKSRSAFGMFIGMFGAVGAAGQLGLYAGMFAYSREHESQADSIGVLLMRKA